MLRPSELAIASASHDGDPVHVAMVHSILVSVGLSETNLGCPADWPSGVSAKTALLKAGNHGPRPIWHNCSGKHAAWLRAAQQQGWSLSDYLDPGHPLQRKIISNVSQLGEYPVTPVGVDGCGAPVLRTTARSMGLLFARLGSLPELRQVFMAMHRYPALVSGSANGDTAIAVALHAAVKRGAQGCLGVALDGGVGVAVKSWDGLGTIAEIGAIATLDALGLLPRTAARSLEPFARPPVRGGGRVVGEIEPLLVLRRS